MYIYILIYNYFLNCLAIFVFSDSEKISLTGCALNVIFQG